jgi:hypothetical protein
MNSGDEEQAVANKGKRSQSPKTQISLLSCSPFEVVIKIRRYFNPSLWNIFYPLPIQTLLVFRLSLFLSFSLRKGGGEDIFRLKAPGCCMYLHISGK